MYSSADADGGAAGVALVLDGPEDAAPIRAVRISARNTVADFLKDLIWVVPGYSLLSRLDRLNVIPLEVDGE